MVFGVSPSAVKLPSVVLGVGELPTGSFAIELEAIVLGLCVGAFCAVLGATSRATSLDVIGICAGPLDEVPREEIGRASEG